MEKQNDNSLLLTAILIIAAFGFGMLVPWTPMTTSMHHSDMSTYNHGEMTMENMDAHRTAFLSYRDSMTDKMRDHGEYRCCLENSCTYCIGKTPGHGEGATCDCLADVVNGVHPCGECIGEILEGHGNKHLAQYYARAISEKVGHSETIKQIISEKYGIPIEKQL